MQVQLFDQTIQIGYMLGQRVRVILGLTAEPAADMVNRNCAEAVSKSQYQIAPVERPGRIAMYHQHYRDITRTLIEKVHAMAGDVEPVRLERVEFFRGLIHVV